WSGGACGGVLPCSVFVNQNLEVRARFDKRQAPTFPAPPEIPGLSLPKLPSLGTVAGVAVAVLLLLFGMLAVGWRVLFGMLKSRAGAAGAPCAPALCPPMPCGCGGCAPAAANETPEELARWTLGCWEGIRAEIDRASATAQRNLQDLVKAIAA